MPSFRSLALALTLVLPVLVVTSTPAQAAGATIAGSAYLPDDGPRADVDLYASPDGGSTWDVVRTQQADESASFAFTDLTSGTYRVCFRLHRTELSDNCWSNALDVEGAVDITVAEGQLVNTIYNQLISKPSMHGTVTGVADFGTNRFVVQPYTWSEASQNWEPTSGWNYTNNRGEYYISEIPPGTYRLCVSDTLGSVPDRCTGGASSPVTAHDVVLGDGEVVRDVDIELRPGGSVWGTLRGPGSRALNGTVDLLVFEPDQEGVWQPVDGVEVSRDAGYFYAPWLPYGTYRFCFLPQDGVDHEPGCWVDAPQPEVATDVVVDRSTVPMYATLKPSLFLDVLVGHTFFDEIRWLAATGITTGYAEASGRTSFRPGQPVLREQMAAFLYRFEKELNGEPVFTPPAVSPFTDVPPSHAFYREITWLASTGITTGYRNPDGTTSFQPSQPVLREQMAAFLYRFDQQDAVDSDGPTFTDVATQHVFYDEIEWLAGTGITTGYREGDGRLTYRGSNPVLREQMAAFLSRYDAGVASE